MGELVAVVPATADIIGKTANGVANDLLSTILLATTGKVLWAPAMNQAMWTQEVQANVAKLVDFGHFFVEPAEGLSACGDMGTGNLADLDKILHAIQVLSTPKNSIPRKENSCNCWTHQGGSVLSADAETAPLVRWALRSRRHEEAARKNTWSWAENVLLKRDRYFRVRSAQPMLEACLALWPDMEV